MFSHLPVSVINAMTKSDSQKEESTWLMVSEGNSMTARKPQQQKAGAGHWVTFHGDTSRQAVKWKRRAPIGSQSALPMTRSTTKLHLPGFPWPPQTVIPTGDQVFKLMSQWETFLTQATTVQGMLISPLAAELYSHESSKSLT